MKAGVQSMTEPRYVLSKSTFVGQCSMALYNILAEAC